MRSLCTATPLATTEGKSEQQPRPSTSKNKEIKLYRKPPNIYETFKVLHIGVGLMEHTEGGAGNPWNLAMYVTLEQ